MNHIQQWMSPTCNWATQFLAHFAQVASSCGTLCLALWAALSFLCFNTRPTHVLTYCQYSMILDKPWLTFPVAMTTFSSSSSGSIWWQQVEWDWAMFFFSGELMTTWMRGFALGWMSQSFMWSCAVATLIVYQVIQLIILFFRFFYGVGVCISSTLVALGIVLFLSLCQTNRECGWGGWSVVWLIHIKCKCSNIDTLQCCIIMNAPSPVVQPAAFWGSHHCFFSGKALMYLLISNAKRSGCHNGWARLAFLQRAST